MFFADKNDEGNKLQKVIEAMQVQADAIKKMADNPTTQNNYTLELVGKKETNIDKNYGPNIENNGSLSLPEELVAKPLPESEDD
jgi:hypothetical protein